MTTAQLAAFKRTLVKRVTHSERLRGPLRFAANCCKQVADGQCNAITGRRRIVRFYAETGAGIAVSDILR